MLPNVPRDRCGELDTHVELPFENNVEVSRRLPLQNDRLPRLTLCEVGVLQQFLETLWGELTHDFPLAYFIGGRLREAIFPLVWFPLEKVFHQRGPGWWERVGTGGDGEVHRVIHGVIHGSRDMERR